MALGGGGCGGAAEADGGAEGALHAEALAIAEDLEWARWARSDGQRVLYVSAEESKHQNEAVQAVLATNRPHAEQFEMTALIKGNDPVKARR